LSDSSGHRTIPSAGGLYPLEVYLVTGNVEGLEAGVYHYLPGEHGLRRIASGDIRPSLASAALDQRWMEAAPAVLVIAAVYERMHAKYGERTVRYVHMEVGAAAQNVYLEAESLGLGTVFVGAFYELRVQSAMELAENVTPLCLMPVGYE
jgi:SagB-type dehydrogenase family enzyme